ncbi:MAG: glycosyltransferase family 39 protein [Planctomycetia bacterium]
MQHLLSLDPKAEYATAWRTDVETVRREARLPSCTKTLLLLWLVAFLLQAIAALLRHYINPDGITYLYTVDFLLEGNLEKGLSKFGINTFIYSLVLLKHLGADPFYAGIWLNAIVSSLVVLPLFGWVRRMFDLRIAVLVSLLYAFHPIILSVGSALMRGPMFWLFFHLTLYWTWRGITEVRLRWMLLAGCSLTLAVHTRSEAWFMIIPILLWALGRFRFATGYRIRLCLGTLLLLAMIPGWIAVLNTTVLKSCPQWGMFRPSHVRQLTILYDKAREKLGLPDRTPEKKPQTPPPSKKPPQKSSPKTSPPKTSAPKPPEKPKPSYVLVGLRRASLRAVKSYSYLYLVYFFIGMTVSRQWRRFATNAQLLMIVPIFLLIWYKSCTNDVSPRYFLPVVFASLPSIALGLLWFARKITPAIKKNKDQADPSSKRAICALVVLLIFTLVVSCFSAVWGTSILEQKECEVGKWILKRFGPDQTICCINRKPRMTSWYAKGKTLREKAYYPVIGPNKQLTSTKPLYQVFQKSKPAIVVCWESSYTPPGIPSLFEILKKYKYFGYQVVEPDILLEYKPKMLVLVRKDVYKQAHVK